MSSRARRALLHVGRFLLAVAVVLAFGVAIVAAVLILEVLADLLHRLGEL